VRRLVGGIAVLAGVALAAPAPAAAVPLGLNCAPAQGVQACAGTVPTWDGVPLDVTVVLPASGGSRLPLVAELNGFGNSKHEYLDPGSDAYTGNAFRWAKAGYVALTYTARGLWGSCGTPESRAANAAACARGYIHLADTRYEARDAQTLIGRLVDDGVADPQRIGVTGDSYGGGQSFELAALRDRTMLTDGRLVPWTSPAGRRLSLAAAAPVIPWTDVVGAIAPNGRTTANGITPAAAVGAPVGVFKASFANAILAAAQNATGPGQPVGEPFVPGRPMGYLAPSGTDPEADVQGWVARSDAGEPYDDQRARDIVATLQRNHSAYGIEGSVPPPPLFVGAGFTDDLFPVDETLRFVNRLRRDHPGTPVSLLFGDFGHQRASNKPADRELLLTSIRAWFDHYVRDRGRGAAPAPGVTATTQTCPRTAPSLGPFHAATFAGLAPGTLRFVSGQAQSFASGGGNPRTAAAIDAVAGGGDACAAVDGSPDSAAASYRLPAAPAGGLTLLGAPRVTASLAVNGAAPADAQVAARLWDVAPGGATKTLVARASYRPAGGAQDAFELHANGWRFDPGHVPELELLGADSPSYRPSNGAFTIDVKRLELALPVREYAAGRAPAGCVRRRRFVVVLPRPGHRALRRARVWVNGRRVRVRSRRSPRITVVQRGRLRAVVRVRILGRTARGGHYRRTVRRSACRTRRS
jgi:dienelactone hydrolase